MPMVPKTPILRLFCRQRGGDMLAARAGDEKTGSSCIAVMTM